jgi:putative ABC transport system permease protein
VVAKVVVAAASPEPATSMMIGETFAVALGALRANKMRSFLTMLGIVIGVSAVIAMIALGRGAQKAVNDRISALGTTLLTITPGQPQGLGGVRLEGQARMVLEDVEFLQERTTLLTAIQPEMERRLQVQYLNSNTNTSIIGTTANYLEVRKYDLAEGRMLTDGDNNARRRVAVLGSQVATNLGFVEPSMAVGQLIKIRGISFEVAGVLASKGQANAFQNPDDIVLVPINTARFRLMGTDRLRSISVLVKDEESIPLAMAEINVAMRRAHKLRPGRPDDFTVRSQADFLNTLGETTQVFTFLLAGIAGVSLLVGGIGIMNIMLVSVTERTREIGVRKALGATKINILLQFLIEAVTLCLLGGAVGVALGAGGAMLMSQLLGWSTSVAPQSVALAFGFSAVVGVLFGVWPARRAAGLDPIVALRYE